MRASRSPIPAALRESTQSSLGSDPIEVSRYLSREWHELEKQYLWPRVWQAVCRETEVSQAGDFFSHDIAGTNVLLVRGDDEQLRAFPNACLHRGRQLKAGAGNSRELKCPYHGFSWRLDGEFSGAPCMWDFPHINEAEFGLPSLQVDTWGGWVFVNQWREAPPLREYPYTYFHSCFWCVRVKFGFLY